MRYLSDEDEERDGRGREQRRVAAERRFESTKTES